VSDPHWDPAGADPDELPPWIDPYPPDDFGPEDQEEEDLMDQPTRDLLRSIEEALEKGPDIQRFRVASALHTLLMPGSTADVAWATEFICNPPGEEAQPAEYARPSNP
jgi:hypothetical protein